MEFTKSLMTMMVISMMGSGNALADCAAFGNCGPGIVGDLCGEGGLPIPNTCAAGGLFCVSGMFFGTCPIGEVGSCSIAGKVCAVNGLWVVYFNPLCCASGSPPSCGDGTCNGSENCSSCPGDCGACLPSCGDGICNGSENCSSCPGDCGACATPPCSGTNLICGTVQDAETNSVPLDGVVIQARERNTGILKAETISQGGGKYEFTNLQIAAGGDYIVNPAPGRTWGPGPNGKRVIINAISVSGQDLDVRGWPAIITVRGKPGASVLLTIAVYNQPNPPTIQAGSSDAYTGTLGTDGTLQMSVAGNYPYYLTCWTPHRVGQVWSYDRTPVIGSQPIGTAGNLIKPADTPNAACPLAVL